MIKGKDADISASRRSAQLAPTGPRRMAESRAPWLAGRSPRPLPYKLHCSPLLVSPVSCGPPLPVLCFSSSLLAPFLDLPALSHSNAFNALGDALAKARYCFPCQQQDDLEMAFSISTATSLVGCLMTSLVHLVLLAQAQPSLQASNGRRRCTTLSRSTLPRQRWESTPWTSISTKGTAAASIRNQ